MKSYSRLALFSLLFLLITSCSQTLDAPSLETAATSSSFVACLNASCSSSVALNGATIAQTSFGIRWKGSASSVEFVVDGGAPYRESIAPFDAYGSDDSNNNSIFKTHSQGTHTASAKVNGGTTYTATFTVVKNLPTPGTSLKDISACSGKLGNGDKGVAIPGNTSHPVALSPDGSVFISYLATATKYPVAVRYNGSSCTPAFTLKSKAAQDTSHDAPSIFVDGDGYISSNYLGRSIWNEKTAADPYPSSPYFRKTNQPNSVTSFGTETKGALKRYAEYDGTRLRNGSVLVEVGGRYNILKKGVGINWQFPVARQVVNEKPDNNYLSTSCKNPGNLFSKTVFFEGGDNTLYVVWGWGAADDNNCPDIRHYNIDNHEVFFAYSKTSDIDPATGRRTWRNLAGNVTRREAECRNSTSEILDCSSGTDTGIAINDPAFKITTMRQGEKRKLWVSANGQIHIAFIQSLWCLQGAACSQQQAPSSTFKPGALMYMTFKLGDSVSQIQPKVVDSGYQHDYIGGIREQDGKVYIWAKRYRQNGADKDANKFMEYVSTNGGTFAGTDIMQANGVSKGCTRLQGDVAAPEFRSVLILAQCSGSSTSNTSIWLYRRDF